MNKKLLLLVHIMGSQILNANNPPIDVVPNIENVQTNHVSAQNENPRDWDWIYSLGKDSEHYKEMKALFDLLINEAEFQPKEAQQYVIESSEEEVKSALEFFNPNNSWSELQERLKQEGVYEDGILNSRSGEGTCYDFPCT